MPEVKIIADLREHEQSRVAILEDGQLAEIFIEYSSDDDDPSHPKLSRLSRQGDIFKARVDTIIPAINAAFVVLTSKSQPRISDRNGRNAYLYLSEQDTCKPGQNVIVQVTKNARQNKAPRVSTRISVPGRWLVLVPESDELGVSHRIADAGERKRLKSIAEALKASAPGYGIVIRTAAEGVPEELLRSDMASLLALWKDILQKAKSAPAPCLLYRDVGILGRVLRDETAGKIDEIIVDEPEEFENAKTFVERFFPEKPNLQLYTGTTPVFEYFGVEAEITRTLDRKVWLRSGAYLVIDQTEALTVIDVNTGKFTSAPDMRHTVLATNLEAAEEIARQLRLRSIGGIVVVDFIDMQEERDRRELLRRFGEWLSRDRLKARVFSLTQLGLVEMTRKRERADLRSILTRSCPLCGGNGYVEREESVALRIKRFLRKIAGSNNAEAYLLQASEHMARHIYTCLDGWQEELGKTILVAGMPEFSREKYRMELLGNVKEVEARAKSLRLQSKGSVVIYRT